MWRRKNERERGRGRGRGCIETSVTPSNLTINIDDLDLIHETAKDNIKQISSNDDLEEPWFNDQCGTEPIFDLIIPNDLNISDKSNSTGWYLNIIFFICKKFLVYS